MSTKFLPATFLSVVLFGAAAQSVAVALPGTHGVMVEVSAKHARGYQDSTIQDGQVFGDKDERLFANVDGANANAHAELSKGLLHVAAATPGWDGDDWASGYYATAEAWLWDIVTIYPDQDVSRITPEMNFDFNGSATGDIAGAYMDVWIDDQWMYSKSGRGDLSYDYFMPAPLTGSYTFKLAVRVGCHTASNSNAPAPAMADYMNTMHLRWNLPAGWRYESASGVFNPENVNPVPEPATMAALGLGAVGLLARRRR